MHSDIWKSQVFVIVTDVHRVLSPTAKERYKWDRHSPSNHREKCLRERTAPWEGKTVATISGWWHEKLPKDLFYA